MEHEHRSKRQRTEDRTIAREEEMNAYIAKFPTSPEGTVKAWEQYEEKATTIYKTLAKIAISDSSDDDEDDSEGANDEDDSEARRVGKAEQLTAELKSVVRNIDMEIAWSGVDEQLQKAKQANDSSPLCKMALKLDRDVKTPIQRRTSKLKKKSELLKCMSRYSNKTEIKTYVTCTRTQDQTEAYDTGEIKEMMAGVKMPSPLKDEQDLQDTMNKDYVDPWWTNQENTDDLQCFSGFLGDLLSKVTLLRPLKSNDSRNDKTVYKSRMEETAQLILDWEPSSDVPNNKVFHFPNEIAAEKQAVQPILYSILRALATTDKESGEDYMDKRNGEDIHRERTYPAIHKQETKRQIDFEAGATRAYTPVALPMISTQIPMEVKNNARKNQNAEPMHFEVIKQDIGHCSKKVSIAFNIGNIGVDGSSTAILLTPVYMQAVQVCLQGTGTDDVEIVTNFSKMFPLVSRTTFNNLVTDIKNRDYLFPKLWPSTDEPEPAIPPGLRHLRDLARTSEEDLGGVFLNTPRANATFQEFKRSQPQEDFVDGPQIEKLIGSGAHGLVYSVSGSNNYCVKASRVGEISHIKRELETLRIFAAGSAAPERIPRLLAMGRLKYNIRNSAVTVPAFLFEPRGIQVSTIWENSCAQREKLIEQANLIWEDISRALDYCHEKKVFHLDSRLPNFIWDPVKKVYVLGDWSSSAVIRGKKGIKGFRGALPFASARVHVLSYNTGWMPKKQHDFAPLGLSVAAFLSGRSVPWSGFYKRFSDANEECFKQRREIASNILNEYNMKQEIVDSFNKTDREGHLH